MKSSASASAILIIVRRILKGLVAVVLVVIAVLMVAWWAGVFQQKIAPGQESVAVGTLDPNRQYPTDDVHQISKEYIEEAVGTLKAASRTEISSRVPAATEITRIAVRAGDIVEPGDVLIELDRQALEAQLKQAQAALGNADAEAQRAKDRYDRAVELRKAHPGVVGDEEFNQLKFNLEAAQANQNRAQQALAEAEVNLSYATIKAPKAGKIVETWAEEGDTVRPGVPLLSLYDPASLRLEVPVMENLAVKLQVGNELEVYIDALDRKFKATIDEIVPQAEAASRSFLVKVSLPPWPGLAEGMFGRLEIPAGTRRHLCLAEAAIERVGQLEFVYVEDPHDGTREKRFIKTGRRGLPGRVEVLSGLRAGERVLLLRQPAETIQTPRSTTEGRPEEDG